MVLKINKFYTKTLLNILFFYFIIIDSINGYLQDSLKIYTPIGVICRGIVFVTIARFLFYKRKDLLYKLFSLVLLLYIVALPIWNMMGIRIDYYQELQYVFKFVYFFCVLSYFLFYKDQFTVNRLCYMITMSAFVISLLNIVCAVTGLGNHSYGEDWGFGTKAFYADGNSLGLYLILSNCISIWYSFVEKKWMYFVTVIISIGTLLIGSRAAMAGVAIAWLLLLAYFVFQKDSYVAFFRFSRFLIGIFLGGGIVYGLVLAFQFILEVDAFTGEKFTLESALSARDHLIVLGKEIIGDFNWVENFIGVGRTGGMRALGELFSSDIEFKSMESDWYDMVLYYGWFFGGLMILLQLTIFQKLFFSFFKYSSSLSFSLLIVACLWMGSSWMAGHAFNNTMLAPLFGSFLVIAYKINSTNYDTCPNNK